MFFDDCPILCVLFGLLCFQSVTNLSFYFFKNLDAKDSPFRGHCGVANCMKSGCFMRTGECLVTIYFIRQKDFLDVFYMVLGYGRDLFWPS